MNYKEWQAQLGAYITAHPELSSGRENTAMPWDIVSGGAGTQNSAEGPDMQYAGWRATLTPEQLQEYDSAVDQNYAKGEKQHRLMMAAAMAAMAAPAAFGAAGGSGGTGALGAANGSWDVLPALAGGSGGGAGAGMGAFIPGVDSAALGNVGALAQVPSWAMPGGASAAQLASMGLGSGAGLNLGSLLGGSGSGTNWLSLLGNGLGGLLGSNAAGKAADTQLQYGREANELAKYIYDQNRADLAPYREAGTGALAGIQALLRDPSSVAQMPDYQFGFDQGTKALNNGAAARGMTFSGQQAKALTKYGNDYAGTKLNDSYNRLASIAGIGHQANTVGTAAGQNYANNVGNTLQGMGNAAGSGYVGQSNAWSNAIGNALSGWQFDNMLNRLKPVGG